MNTLLNALKDNANFTHTENGALTHKTTKSALLDMFAMGAAMRKRSEEDVILMWRKAFAENPVYALRCLFYIRDIRGGQGERRFFRVCMKDLATQNIEAAKRNLAHIPEFGRWDDLYLFVGTKLEKDAFQMMKRQLALDMECKTPSLLAKWLKSENTSSQVSRDLGNKTRMAFGIDCLSLVLCEVCVRLNGGVLTHTFQVMACECVLINHTSARRNLVELDFIPLAGGHKTFQDIDALAQNRQSLTILLMSHAKCHTSLIAQVSAGKVVEV